jgi:hypothetical protein
MTEHDWLQATDPWPMLEYLHGKASDRKLRLFAVACCWRIWPLLANEPSRAAVEVAERYADATASEQELSTAAVVMRPDASFDPYDAIRAAEAAVWLDPHSASHFSALAAACDSEKKSRRGAGQPRFSSMNEARKRERLLHCGLLRDLFGFLALRPITLEPAWLAWHGGLLVSMARQMYDSRDFTDMPVLADALEEAGCDNADILAHSRGDGPHVRGCWVVDLLLGKE